MAETRTYPHSELTSGIIAAFYQVYNHLGYGFLEKVYENALVHELRKRGYEVGPIASIENVTEKEIVAS
jgi:GxxExxY protein